MTTKAAALYQFFSSFDIPAYVSTGVPDDAEYPYLTYEVVTGAWGDGELNSTVNLWYKTDSEKIPNDKVNEISKSLGLGGTTIPCDDGAVMISRGEPWCNALEDDSDHSIKRRLLNVTLEYTTTF
jgi:hypothetical protein